MKQNLKVISYGSDEFMVCFIRPSGVRLTLVQGLSGRYMKNADMVKSPVVIFDSREEAEAEIRTVVIPQLIKDKGVEPQYIVGW